MNTTDSDRERITQLLLRYATGIDQRDWELFRNCWTDEVTVDYGPVGTFTDPDALTDMVRQIHGAMGDTYHRLTNFTIAIAGDRASARTYVQAVLMLVPGDQEKWIEATGHYDDDLVRTDDGWRIRTRTTYTARMLSNP